VRKYLVGILVVAACLTVLVPSLAKADTLVNPNITGHGAGIVNNSFYVGPYTLVDQIAPPFTDSLWYCFNAAQELSSPWWALETNLQGAIDFGNLTRNQNVIIGTNTYTYYSDNVLREVAYLASETPGKDPVQLAAINVAIWEMMGNFTLTSCNFDNNCSSVAAYYNDAITNGPNFTGDANFLIPLQGNGTSLTWNPQNQPFVQTPEPGSFLVFGSALGWLGFALRRHLKF